MLNNYPKDWQKTTLGDVAFYINGYAFKPEDWKETGLPIIRIQQINDPEADCDYFDGPIPEQYIIDDGDLLFSWSATLTTLIWNRGPAILNQHIYKVVPKEGANLRFLHHLLDYLMDELAGQTHGTTMKHITRSNLLPFPSYLPPLPEQHRIAEILDAADDAIRQTERVVAKLRQAKAGLLHDLLTCGLDAHGHLRDPDAHPEQFKDSPLGKIPKEWGVKTIDDLAVHIGSGATPRGGSEVYQSEGVVFVRSQNVTFEGLLLEDVAHISNAIHQNMARSEIFAHDVLLNITGASIGRCCPVPEGLGLANVNQHVCAIRLPDPNHEDAVFLSMVLASNIGQHQIDQLNAGSNREGLNYRQLRSFIIPWPKINTRTCIAATLDAADARIRAEEATLAKLRQVKRGLMDDLLTGRVRVK